jgi:hypothetical protein
MALTASADSGDAGSSLAAEARVLDDHIGCITPQLSLRGPVKRIGENLLALTDPARSIALGGFAFLGPFDRSSEPATIFEFRGGFVSSISHCA